jgi:hypothetical protein
MPAAPQDQQPTYLLWLVAVIFCQQDYKQAQAVVQGGSIRLNGQAVQDMLQVVRSADTLVWRNYSGAPGDGEWLAHKDSYQCSKHSMPLLAHGGAVTTNAAKGSCPLLAAKGARNLLLHFAHPQITLRLMVGAGHPQIFYKRQHVLGSPQQVIQHVLGRTLLASSPSLWQVWWGWGCLGGKADCEHLEIAGLPLHPLFCWHTPGSSLPPLPCRRLLTSQQIFHLKSPRLVFLFFDRGQIPYQMRPAPDSGRTPRDHNWPNDRAWHAPESAASCQSRLTPGVRAWDARPGASASACG